jgi:1-deoxy-D-xylulose-5-phosphate synthase
MTVMAPADENECRQMLYTAYQLNTPTAVRYPRGCGPGVKADEAMQALPVGRGVVRRNGKKVAILAFGSMLAPALAAAEKLDATVVNMRFVKPLDSELVLRMAAEHSLLVTVEENTIQGGAGSAVAECLMQNGVLVPLLQLGLPDTFIEQGEPAKLLKNCGLDAEGIEISVRNRMSE